MSWFSRFRKSKKIDVFDSKGREAGFVILANEKQEIDDQLKLISKDLKDCEKLVMYSVGKDGMGRSHFLNINPRDLDIILSRLNSEYWDIRSQASTVTQAKKILDDANNPGT